MSWWRTVRSRPSLTQVELSFLSWRTVIVLLMIVIAVVGWTRLGTSPSGFHMKGRLVDKNSQPVAGVFVGYNYAWKGHYIPLDRHSMIHTNHRAYPRVFGAVITDMDGLFAIDLDMKSIGYVTILGFWQDEKLVSQAVWYNQRKIDLDDLPNRGHLIPWDDGVVKHYEPGWRVRDAIFGWGSNKVEEFVMESSGGKANANK